MFSIIIPVYNVAQYLRECLDSVLAQTFGDWEAICVDDGSTDGSAAILDEYAAKDARFRVIHQENAGVSAARNAALDAAKGEFFLFLDGDDLLRNDALEMFAFHFERNQSLDGILVYPYIPWWPATSAEPTDEGTKAAIAMSLAQAGDEDIAAIAYALYLARDAKHDIPTAMISLKQHETAWNTKSIGMNNVGF